jgi:hypothetical protein
LQARLDAAVAWLLYGGRYGESSGIGERGVELLFGRKDLGECVSNAFENPFL